MSAGRWAYRLGPGARKRPPKGLAAAWRLLQAGFTTQVALERTLGPGASEALYLLDRQGLLEHEWRLSRRPLFRLLPQGPALQPTVAQLPRQALRLVDHWVGHSGPEGLRLEAADGGAQVQVMHAPLAALLPLLAAGSSWARLMRAWASDSESLELWLLALLRAGLLHRPGTSTWPLHELLFHRRTRRGYGFDLIGKQAEMPAAPAPMPAGPRLPLPRIEADALDMPLGLALARRRSHRETTGPALTLNQLGTWLGHALATSEGPDGPHRPYPSGGGTYSLRPTLLVRQCKGLQPGSYAYDAVRHELTALQPLDATMRRLLQQAAATARLQGPPQVLLVLCAEMGRMHQAYGSLAYSLLLKEVGAVMQTLQLVAAARGWSCCPLGTGNEPEFARVAGLDPLQWPCVGEVLLGRAPQRAAR